MKNWDFECTLAKIRIRVYIDFMTEDKVKWEGQYPLYSKTYATMFWCIDDIFEFCYDYMIKPDYLCLHLCEPIFMNKVCLSQWDNQTQQYKTRIPSNIRTMIHNLNLAISKSEPIGYRSTNIGVIL